MKKIRVLLVMLIMCLSLAGCIKFRFDTTIKNNRSMEISLIYAMDTQYFEDNWFEPQDIEDLKKDGWTVSNYQDEQGYAGVVLTGKVEDIDTLLGSGPFTADLSDFVENGLDNKIFWKEGNVYHARWSIDLGEGADYISMMDLKLVVHLPNNALSDNSTSTNKKELSWDLTRENPAEFSFKLSSGSGSILIGIGLVAAAAVALFFVFRKKKPAPQPVKEETASAEELYGVIEDIDKKTIVAVNEALSETEEVRDTVVDTLNETAEVINSAVRETAEEVEEIKDTVVDTQNKNNPFE